MPDTLSSLAKPTILVVEDEAPLLTLLRYNLEKQGFRVEEAADGQEALLRVAETKPDLVLLDWMLPGQSGLLLARRWRADARTRELPIIMLTARAEEADRIRGLETGADDYVTKPFSPRELVARVRAVLRRLRPALQGGNLDYAGIIMDTSAHKVTREGRTVQLGPTEFRLLRHFLEHPGRVFSREQLLDAVWGRDVYVEQRTVDVHIRRLRKAVNSAGGTEDLPDVIRTVRSAGYALDIELVPARV